MTEEQIEKNAHGQAVNKLWFKHREGRITSSNFKTVVENSPSMASTALIKQMCYPEGYKFTTESTR